MVQESKILLHLFCVHMKTGYGMNDLLQEIGKVSELLPNFVLMSLVSIVQPTTTKHGSG